MKQYRTLNDGEIVMSGDEFWGIDRSWIPATEIGKKVTSYTHKMYRRPLTETSSQTTDTCPDCSNEVCDCGLPAGYNEADIRFAANFAPHIKVVEVSKLIEVMQQRDELLRYNKAFRQDTLICADCDAISKEEYDRAIEQRDGLRSAVDYASDQLTRVTEQRDRLAATIERLKELPDTWRNECQGNWLRGGVVLQLADDFDAAVKGGADE